MLYNYKYQCERDNEMILYFVNGSKQKKYLVESDYAEDIIDVIVEFFESHNRFPHRLELVVADDEIIVKIANTTEYFLITEVASEDADLIKEWIDKY